jgi:hypothetical protein
MQSHSVGSRGSSPGWLCCVSIARCVHTQCNPIQLDETILTRQLSYVFVWDYFLFPTHVQGISRHWFSSSCAQIVPFNHCAGSSNASQVAECSSCARYPMRQLLPSRGSGPPDPDPSCLCSTLAGSRPPPSEPPSIGGMAAASSLLLRHLAPSTRPLPFPSLPTVLQLNGHRGLNENWGQLRHVRTPPSWPLLNSSDEYGTK